MYERWEIVSLYKEAQDKEKQIEILADLNACSKEEIINILLEEGAISGVSKKMVKKEIAHKAPKRQSERGKWTAERIEELQKYIDEGIPKKEIAERMGEERQCIYDAAHKYIKKEAAHYTGETRREGKTTTKAVYDTGKQLKDFEKEEKLGKEIVRLKNDLMDINANALIAKDILRMIEWIHPGDLARYEDTIGTLCVTVEEVIDNIIDLVNRSEEI